MTDAAPRFVPADRIRSLPPYVFTRVFALRDEALARGQRVFDMGVGNPDGRPPEHVVTALVDAVRDPRANVHRYSTFNGSPALRRSRPMRPQ